MSNNVEEAATLCQLLNELIWGSKAQGSSPFNVNLNVSCPQGGEAIGIFHTHPGGEPVPSAQDIAEAKRLNLSALCVSVPEKQIIRCSKVR